MSVIELQDIGKVYGYGESATVALHDVNFSVQKDEFVAIMGPSGSGKSTLLHIIGLLDSPTVGSYKLDGKKTNKVSKRKKARVRRDKLGFVFQSFNLLPNITAVENVSLPLIYKGVGHVERLERAAEAMGQLGIHDRQYYMPHQLSGGQAQRVAIARALVNNPSIILADEPTGNLDTDTGVQMMELFQDLNDLGHTILMITHNPKMASFANRVVRMVDGTVVEDERLVKKPGTHRRQVAR